MPRARHRASLGTKLLIILLAAVLVPSVVVAVILIRTGAEAERREALSGLELVNEAVSDEVSDFISDADSILASTGAFPAFAERDREAQLQTLRNILARSAYFRSLRVYYEPAVAFAVADTGTPEWDPPDALLRDGFRQAIEGGTFISPVHYTPTGDALVLLMSPITPPGTAPAGVVAGVVGLDRVQTIADRFSMSNQRSVIVVDQSGRALALPDTYDDLEIGDPLLELDPVSRLQENQGRLAAAESVVYTDPLGQRTLAAYDRIDDLGWGVVVQQPVSLLIYLPYRSVAITLLWMIGFVLLFALLGRYVSLRGTRPLARLKEGAEIIGAGDLHHRVDIRTGDELEDVADAFNRTVARLETSYSELEHEHNRAVLAARQADTLYSVSQALVSTLRLDERLDLIAHSLADVCNTDKVAIWLLEGIVLVPYTSYGLTPDEEIAFRNWVVHLEEATGMTRRVIETLRPMAISNVEADTRVPPRAARAFHMKSVLALPLVIEDDVIGYAITYVSDEIHEFTDYEIAMAKAVAAQAAVAIQNVRAYERERRISETLQRSLLPQVPPRIGAFEIADKYESALAEAEVGGDFYDLVELSPTKIGFVMADVSGKGLSAAVHTAMIKYMLRAYTLEDIDSVEMIRRLNQAVWRYIGGQMFITLFYGVLDTETKQLRYVNAGHELPLLFGEGRRICTRLETTGTALGIVPEYDFGEECIEFLSGDSLLLYTDGATDVRREGRFLGEDGLEEMFCNAAHGTAHQIVDAVDTGIREYAGGELHDDVALMVIKYREAEEPVL